MLALLSPSYRCVFSCENTSHQLLSNTCWLTTLGFSAVVVVFVFFFLFYFFPNCEGMPRSSQQRLCIRGEDAPRPLLSNTCWHSRCWLVQLSAFFCVISWTSLVPMVTVGLCVSDQSLFGVGSYNGCVIFIIALIFHSFVLK